MKKKKINGLKKCFVLKIYLIWIRTNNVEFLIFLTVTKQNSYRLQTIKKYIYQRKIFKLNSHALLKFI